MWQRIFVCYNSKAKSDDSHDAFKLFFAKFCENKRISNLALYGHLGDECFHLFFWWARFQQTNPIQFDCPFATKKKVSMYHIKRRKFIMSEKNLSFDNTL